tara:strand:- start:62251 stop:62697 length:447 start_codon:yes stop_codon:yes gene_type:complete
MSLYSFCELLDPPSKNQLDFLYKLLSNREVTISHTKMPSFKEHVHFVLNNPYEFWFILKYNNKNVGSLYINSDNSVGIHLLKEFNHLSSKYLNSFEQKFKPLNEIKSKRSKYFSFNISPKDKYMKKLLESNDYQIVQLSYQKKITPNS